MACLFDLDFDPRPCVEREHPHAMLLNRFLQGITLCETGESAQRENSRQDVSHDLLQAIIIAVQDSTIARAKQPIVAHSNSVENTSPNFILNISSQEGTGTLGLQHPNRVLSVNQVSSLAPDGIRCVPARLPGLPRHNQPASLVQSP